MIDLLHPLVPGFGFEDEDGDKLWIQFKYEKITDLCFNYGHLGHTQNLCNDEAVEMLGPYGFRIVMRAKSTKLSYSLQ